MFQSLAGNIGNKKFPDDWLGDQSQRADAKSQVVHDFHQHSIRRVGESPNDFHSLRKGLEMVEADFHFLTVDHLLTSPGNRDARPVAGHFHHMPIRGALEVTDIPVMGKNPRPLREVGGSFKDLFPGCSDEYGVAGVHDSTGYTRNVMTIDLIVFHKKVFQAKMSRLRKERASSTRHCGRFFPTENLRGDCHKHFIQQILRQ